MAPGCSTTMQAGETLTPSSASSSCRGPSSAGSSPSKAGQAADRLQSGKSVFILVDTSRRIQRVEVRSRSRVSYRYDRRGEGFALKE